MLQVLLAVPGEAVEIKRIGEGMNPIRELVGGPVECVQLGDGYTLYCNQDSTERDLPVNPHFAQGIVKGAFVIARTAQDGGGHIGLDDNDIRFIEQTFIRR